MPFGENPIEADSMRVVVLVLIKGSRKRRMKRVQYIFWHTHMPHAMVHANVHIKYWQLNERWTKFKVLHKNLTNVGTTSSMDQMKIKYKFQSSIFACALKPIRLFRHIFAFARALKPICLFRQKGKIVLFQRKMKEPFNPLVSRCWPRDKRKADKIAN